MIKKSELQLDTLKKMRDMAVEKLKAEEAAKISAPLVGDYNQVGTPDEVNAIADQRKARQLWDAELSVLRQRALGHTRMADAMQLELNLRAEAATLAKSLNISEDEAVNKLTEQYKLRQKINQNLQGEVGRAAAQRKDPFRQKLHASARETMDRVQLSQGRRIEAGFGRKIEAAPWRKGSLNQGLRQHELKRREQERRSNPTSTDFGPAIKSLSDIKQSNDEILAVFKKFGVI